MAEGDAERCLVGEGTGVILIDALIRRSRMNVSDESKRKSNSITFCCAAAARRSNCADNRGG